MCLFHNCAHIEDSSRRLFILSSAQMESSGVIVNVDYNRNAGDSPEMLEKDEHSFKLKQSPPLFLCDKRTTLQIDLEPVPEGSFWTTPIVNMIDTKTWIPPFPLGSKKLCLFCGALGCSRLRCMKFHSFGLCVVAPRALRPGECFVHDMKK